MPSSQDRGAGRAARRGFGEARACLVVLNAIPLLVAASSSTASNSLSVSLASYLNSNNETMTPTACDWLADGVTLAISGFGNNTMNEISAPSSSPQLGDDDPGPFASSAMIFNLNTSAGAVSGISRIDNRIDVLRASPAGVIIVGDIGVAFTDPGINDIVWQADVPEGPVPGFEGRCLGARNATCRADVAADGSAVVVLVPLNSTTDITLYNVRGNVTGRDSVGNGGAGCVATDVAIGGAELGLFFETGYCDGDGGGDGAGGGGGGGSGGGSSGVGSPTVAFIRAKRVDDPAGAPAWTAWGWPSAPAGFAASTRGLRLRVGEDGAHLAFAGACDAAAPGLAAVGCVFSLSPQNASRAAANLTESDVYDTSSGIRVSETTTIAFHAVFDAASGRQLWARYNVALNANGTFSSVVPGGIALSQAGDLYAAATVLAGGCAAGCASASVSGQPVGAPAAGRTTGVLLVQPTTGSAAQRAARKHWLGFAAPGASGAGNSAGLDVAVRGALAAVVVAGDHEQRFVEVGALPWTAAPDQTGIRTGFAAVWSSSAMEGAAEDGRTVNR